MNDFWEDCWRQEDREAVARWQASWSRACGELGSLFRAHGVRTVCDGACGFGAYTLALAAQGFAVSAFDLSPTSVELTRRGLARLGLTAEVKTASLLDTGYPDASFDAAVAASVLDHLTAADAERAAAELCRIIRPGGLLLVSFDTPEEEDLNLAHDVLPDGTFRYAQGTGRAGMLFRVCGEAERAALLAGLEPVWERRAAGGRYTAVLRRPSLRAP